MSAKKNYSPQILPLMPLREVVIFPNTITPLFVGRESSITAIETAGAEYDNLIFLAAQKNASVNQPSTDDLYTVGTICRILQVLRLPDNTIKVLFEGIERAYWEPVNQDSDQLDLLVKTYSFADINTVSEETEVVRQLVLETLEEYNEANKRITPDIMQSITALRHPGELADAIAPYLKLPHDKKQILLEESNASKRLEALYALFKGELSVLELEKRIKTRVKNQMEANQREYYLNEQIKAIHKEMGREDDPNLELDELVKKLESKSMPDEAREKTLREIKKLRYMSVSSAEYTVIRNYVDWVLDLPWNHLKETTIDIHKAKTILDEDHYGLEKPKERILEFLAVQKMVNSLRGPILCLVGPPGVGKTSLARSVAKATGREFIRLSLGGVRDEAEIRGHRRTYIGALPGKIIQSLKRVSSNNPLFCLDEVDKMTSDFRGDPSAALLEVLDPEQNNTFVDHYLDLDYDLSQIFFITTANSLHNIPLPLQDRMEIIRLPGYLETEKKSIARHFLIPKQTSMHGLAKDAIKITDQNLLTLIRSYTREAGVRNLEREIATICRKVAMQTVSSEFPPAHTSISEQRMQKYLGVPKYRYGEKEEEAQIGVCAGLAYTEMGGEILIIETAIMPGSGKVNITGKLGEVMTESAQAAVSYVRSRSEIFNLRPDFHKDIDIHIHVPEGATPKDGPSAGITLATSLISALLGIPVHNSVAMTGEITLRGRVLPIGGLREKLLAARRALIPTVVIPKDNQKDIKDVPSEILKDLQLVFVEHVDEVLPIALQSAREELFPGRGNAIPLYCSLQKNSQITEAPLAAQ